MKTLKQKTLTLNNIIVCKDNYYRYVNHNDKLITLGFKTKEALIKWSGLIRFDNLSIKLMNKRYYEFFKPCICMN